MRLPSPSEVCRLQLRRPCSQTAWKVGVIGCLVYCEASFCYCSRDWSSLSRNALVCWIPYTTTCTEPPQRGHSQPSQRPHPWAREQPASWCGLGWRGLHHKLVSTPALLIAAQNTSYLKRKWYFSLFLANECVLNKWFLNSIYTVQPPQTVDSAIFTFIFMIFCFQINISLMAIQF